MQKEVAALSTDELATKRSAVESAVKHQLSQDQTPASWGLDVRNFSTRGADGAQRRTSATGPGRVGGEAGPGRGVGATRRNGAGGTRRDAAYAHEAATRKRASSRTASWPWPRPRPRPRRSAPRPWPTPFWSWRRRGSAEVAADVVARTSAAALARPVSSIDKASPAVPVAEEVEKAPAPPPPAAQWQSPSIPCRIFRRAIVRRWRLLGNILKHKVEARRPDAA